MISPSPKNKLQNTQEEFETNDQFFQVATYSVHPSHLQPEMNDTSFCSLVGLFSTKQNHYFNVSVDSNIFSSYLKVTIKIGDTVPLSLF